MTLHEERAYDMSIRSSVHRDAAPHAFAMGACKEYHYIPCGKDPGDTARTADLLEGITARLIRHIRNHDWTHPDWTKYVADGVKVHVPAAFLEHLHYPSTSSRQAYLESYSAFAKANPDYDCEPLSIEADVDKMGDTAKVWVIMSVTGHPPSLRKESITVLHWVRMEDGWIMTKKIGIRGFPAY